MQRGGLEAASHPRGVRPLHPFRADDQRMLTSEAGQVRMSGSLLITAGVVTALVGLAAVFWPDVTLLVLAILAGINLFIMGVVAIVESFGAAHGARALSAVLGILALIAGIVLIRRPEESLLAFVLILGVWFVISATVSFVRALFEKPDRGLRMVVAGVEFVFGVLILALPELSLGTLAVLTGIAFAIRGAFLIAAGMALRKEGQAEEAQWGLSTSPSGP